MCSKSYVSVKLQDLTEMRGLQRRFQLEARPPKNQALATETAPLMTWMADWPAGSHFAPIMEAFAPGGPWSNFDQQLLCTVREGKLSSMVLNN